jgi:hypothetical protein
MSRDVTQPGASAVREIRELTIGFLGLGGLIAAIVVVTGQVLVWLKTGHWPDISLATFIVPATEGSPFAAWLSRPESWYGMHSVVKALVVIPVWMWIVPCAAAVIKFVLG